MLGAQAALLTQACASPDPVGPPTIQPDEPRVAIVGAGVAGLSCAYWLNQARIDVSVYEANSARVGGRTFTGRGLFESSPASACEFGGEFVEPYHAAVWALARELGIALEPGPSPNAPSRIDFFWLEGKRVPEETILAQLKQVAERITLALNGANQNSRLFFQLDSTSLGTWLSENVPARDFPELSLALTLAYQIEFGVDVDQQSALNLVHLIGDAVEPSYSVFGQARSTYRVRGGADSLAVRMAESLLGRVRLDSQLTSVEKLGAKHALTFHSRTGAGFRAEADRVVLALPFTVVRRIPLVGLEVPENIRSLIQDLRYGAHCRTVGAFTQAVWRDPLLRSSVASDLGFQQVREGSINLTDTRGGLLASTLSGTLAEKARESDVQASYAAMLNDLNLVFENVSSVYVQGSARRVHWQKQPFARGSRSCRKAGQWSTRGLAQLPLGNLRFCGEHCSIDFPGTIEGAAETGALVAGQLILELGHKLPLALEQLLKVKNVVFQPCCEKMQNAGPMWPVTSPDAMQTETPAVTDEGTNESPSSAQKQPDGTTTGFLERLQRVLESHREFTSSLL